MATATPTTTTTTDMLINTTNHLRLIKSAIVTAITTKDAENKKFPQPRWMR
jgi:hypothetical protein